MEWRGNEDGGEWVFSENEKETIMSIISIVKNPRENVKGFIEILEERCSNYKFIFDDLRNYSRTSYKYNREQLWKALEKAHDLLRKTAANELPLIPKQGIDIDYYLAAHHEVLRKPSANMTKARKFEEEYYKKAGPTISKVYSRLNEHRENAMDEIEKIAACLTYIDRRTKAGKGRPRADESNFVGLVALMYDDMIEKPTSYEEGRFYQLIRELYKITGLWIKDDPDGNKEPDVSRSIKDALEKLKQSYLVI